MDSLPYQYYLLPSANPPAHLASLHNKIYHFWKSTWSGVLRDLNVEGAHLEDDFLRQDLIAAICKDSEIIAVHLYSFFAIDSDASRSHPYMAGNYQPQYFTKLAETGVRTAMSMEYMTVNPAWRKSVAPVHMGAVLVGLAMDTLCHYGIDAAIAPARRDHKVHEIVYAFGGECVIENVVNHNVPCDLLACRREKVKANEDQSVQKLREVLWDSRYHINALGGIENRKPALKRVA